MRRLAPTNTWAAPCGRFGPRNARPVPAWVLGIEEHPGGSRVALRIEEHPSSSRAGVGYRRALARLARVLRTEERVVVGPESAGAALHPRWVPRRLGIPAKH